MYETRFDTFYAKIIDSMLVDAQFFNFDGIFL